MSHDFSAFEAPSMATRHLSDELREWLEAKADAGTSIDSGGGFGCRDLWVMVGGHEFHVRITDKGPREGAAH